MILAAGGSAANASELDSFYVGIGGGTSSMKGVSSTESTIIIGPLSAIQSIPINGLSFDDRDTTWSAFVGYEITRHFGVEAGYRDLGTFEQRLSSLEGSRAQLGVSGWYLDATARYPLAPGFSVHAHAGVLRARFEVEGSTTFLVTSTPGLPPFIGRTPIIIGTQTVALATPDDETGWQWGVGLGWQALRNMELLLDFSQHEARVQKLDTLGVSARFSF